ncbi:hypothetical protein [Bradyrhizobium sp. USDA 4350]
MTARQGELLPKPPRRSRGVLMHVCDAGGGEGRNVLCQMQCRKCGHRSGWLIFDTVTEAKRGIPCPKCNGATQ